MIRPEYDEVAITKAKEKNQQIMQALHQFQVWAMQRVIAAIEASTAQS